MKMRRIRSKKGVSVLLALFLLLLIHTDVRAALFSGLSFIGHSLADEFTRIFVNTFDARSISEDELPIIKPVEKEEKLEEEFFSIESAEFASAVNNSSTGRQILASPITTMTSYSVSGGGESYSTSEDSGGGKPDSIGLEQKTVTDANMQKELQLEEKVLQEELLRLIGCAEAERRSAEAEGTGCCAAGTGDSTADASVSGIAPVEQTSTTAADAYTQHLNTVEAINNVNQLLGAMQQETSAGQPTGTEGIGGCAGGICNLGAAPAGQTNTSTTLQQSVIVAQAETIATQSTGGQGYCCSGGVCYFGAAPADAGTSGSSGYTHASSSTTAAQSKNLSQQIADILAQGTADAAQSATAQSSAYCSGGVCYPANIIEGEGALPSTDSASYLYNTSSYNDYDFSNDLSSYIAGSSETSAYYDDISESVTGAELSKRISELEWRIGEVEKEVYGFTYGSSDVDDNYSSAETLDMAQLQRRLIALETRVAALESVMKDIEEVLTDILGSDLSNVYGDNPDGMASAVTDIEDRLSALMGEPMSDAQTTVADDITKMVVAQTEEGYVFLSYGGEGDIQPLLLLGGAVQASGQYHISLYYEYFMPLVEPVVQIAGTLAANGHNCIKIYLPPNNLTDSDAQYLALFIKELYASYNIKTYLLHFSGLYAGSGEEYLLNNPSEVNLGKTAELIKEFAQWVKDLGPAVAAVQLGNENEYYLADAGVFDFVNEEWPKINLSTGAYHSFMNQLAGIYKQIDQTHPVFLGHGELSEEQISLLKNNIGNYDGLAINSYCNWNEEHQSFESVMSKEELEQYFAAQVQIAAAIGKPLILSEFSETSYGDLGESGQKEFVENITEVLGKFMIGSNSAQPHIIVGLFWYEYFPEYWKDEAHPSLSDIALFEQVNEAWEIKEAFAGLSAGYKEINENLQGLINSAVASAESENDSNAQTVKQQDKRVTVYTGPGCTYCEKVKELLRENNVEFTEVDLTTDTEAAQKIIALCGQLVAPVVDIDGEIIVGFNEEKMLAALGMDKSADLVVVQETGENTLDKDDSGRVIVLEQGEELSIKLSSNPTTGYDWDVYGVDENILQVEGTNYELSDAAGSGLVGAGGAKTFYFRAVNAGVTTLVLTYQRPWEDAYNGIFYVTIFVK